MRRLPENLAAHMKDVAKDKEGHSGYNYRRTPPRAEISEISACGFRT
jgi:hypothetical protein